MCLLSFGSSPSQMIAVWSARVVQMPVDAIVGGVERAVLVPFDRDVALEARVLDLGIGLDPMEPLALLAPEFRRIGDRFRVELFVFRLVDPGAVATVDGTGIVLSSGIGEGSLIRFAGRIKPLLARQQGEVNGVFTMLRQGEGMAMSPVSGTPSPAQLAVMEQIRALRAAKAPVSVQATAPVQSAAPVQMRPAAAQPAPAPPLATATATANSMLATRPRGSILKSPSDFSASHSRARLHP